MEEPPLNETVAGPGATKRCEYCGKDNAEAAVVCDGCSTPFPPPVLSVPEAPITGICQPEVPQLNARSATAIFLLSFAAQFGAAFVVGLGVGFLGALHGGASRSQTHSELAQTVMPLAALAAMLGMGATVLAASIPRFGANLKDASPTGAAWVVGSAKDIVKGAGLGVVCVIAFFAVASLPFFRTTNVSPGPLTKMSMTPGIPQIAWVILATLLAPPIEELLFRGVMYGGYRRSFGPRRAAILVTLIFCAMHVTEVIHSPIALFGIGSMACAALWMRLRAGAIGPAVAVHFSYNSIIAVLQVIASMNGS